MSRPEQCPVCEFAFGANYLRCPQCEGRTNRARVDTLAATIREYKDLVKFDADPEHESQIVQRLVEHGHPDVNGLIAWVQAKREEGRSPRKGKS